VVGGRDPLCGSARSASATLQHAQIFVYPNSINSRIRKNMKFTISRLSDPQLSLPLALSLVLTLPPSHECSRAREYVGSEKKLFD
jgi:hypothetical protein